MTDIAHPNGAAAPTETTPTQPAQVVMPPQPSREFAQQMIRSLLMAVDAWERLYNISPRTKEMRDWYKRKGRSS
jgi:hypothetical protein